MNIQKNKKTKIIAISVVIFIIAAAAAYIISQRTDTSNSAAPSTQQQTQQHNDTQPVPADPRPEPEGVTPVKEYELITENEQYKIRREPNSQNYVITLYAIVNRPEQYNQYQDQLREFKQNALQYLQNTGIDIKTINITYEPEEAKDL